jgi:hydroxymethylpyrimidine/phosphomethylpyrimidine kinase
MDVLGQRLENGKMAGMIEKENRPREEKLKSIVVMKNYKRVLTIAGSDPSGGAGIQADLKTMSACGCFGMSAITAVVDENTIGVTGVHPVPVAFVQGQIRSVLDDVGADAIKIGMLHSSELILAVKQTLCSYSIRNLVLDPVMVATSGDKLLQDEAIGSLKNELIPQVRVITPNIPEAELLLGEKISSQQELPIAAKKLSCNGKVSVFLKAGHLTDENLIDIFYNAETDEVLELQSKRIVTRNTHGTGCTLSSAVASFLAHGFPLNDAIRQAKEYISQAILHGSQYEIGKGHGPVHHFYQFWE